MNFPNSTFDVTIELNVLAYLIQTDASDFFSLTEKDFYNHLHRKVFNEIKAGQKPSPQKLIELGLKDESAWYIHETFLSNYDTQQNAKNLRQMTAARKLWYDSQKNMEILNKATPGSLESIVGSVDIANHVFTPETALERMKTEVLPNRVIFEPSSINQVLRFFSTKWVCYIVASMGVGKTSAGIQIGRSIGECEGSITLFCSLEMAFESFYERCYSIKYYENNPEADYQDWLKCRDNLDFHAMGKVAIHPNEILLDKRGMSISEIKQMARQLIAQGKNIKTIVIDHIYILKPESDNKTENENQGKLASALDALAKDLDVRVLALCQTTKKAGDQKFMEPYITDIRGSKALGEICSWALLLWRDQNDPRKLLWKSEKYRYGEDGSGYLLKNGTYFYDDPTVNFNPRNY